MTQSSPYHLIRNLDTAQTPHNRDGRHTSVFRQNVTENFYGNRSNVLPPFPRIYHTIVHGDMSTQPPSEEPFQRHRINYVSLLPIRYQPQQPVEQHRQYKATQNGLTSPCSNSHQTNKQLRHPTDLHPIHNQAISRKFTLLRDSFLNNVFALDYSLRQPRCFTFSSCPSTAHVPHLLLPLPISLHPSFPPSSCSFLLVFNVQIRQN